MTHIKLSTQTFPTQTNNTVPLPAGSVIGSTDTALPFPSSGPLVVPMTNDYLFRALLQQNNRVLKGLICSLLRLSEEEVLTAEITNPIELGTSLTDKTFILDVKVSLNNLAIINLELQVINQHNWVERSLSYLCRSFDTLQAGQNYLNAKPVIQIGLLNYTLFPEHPEFYASYQLLNVKNNSLYSDKLRLSVLDLTQIDLATEEDKSCQLDLWARLFRATTWEEINMLVQENQAIKEAAGTVYQLTQEERIRMECEAREDFYRTQRDIQYLMDKQTAENQTLIQKTKALLDERNALANEINVLADENNALTNEINVLADKNVTLANEVKELEDKLSKLQKLLEKQASDSVEIQ